MGIVQISIGKSSRRQLVGSLLARFTVLTWPRSRSGSIGVEKSLELYKRTQS
jgi:hypothetical protein